MGDLNVNMGKLESVRDELLLELKVLSKEITALKASQTKATKLRNKEKVENAATVTEAKGGLSAIKMAIDILDKFYKTAAKATVLQQQEGSVEDTDDAPDAGFMNNETYKGAQSSATGILGMMDVIKSDFVRTVKTTEQAEQEAADAFLTLMTETGKSLAVKTQAQLQKKSQKDDAVQDLTTAKGQLDTQSGILVTTITELKKLKKACVDTGMSYKDRVAIRAQEMKSLKKALCILEAYAMYGPSGVGTAC